MSEPMPEYDATASQKKQIDEEWAKVRHDDAGYPPYVPMIMDTLDQTELPLEYKLKWAVLRLHTILSQLHQGLFEHAQDGTLTVNLFASEPDEDGPGVNPDGDGGAGGE